MLSSLQEKLLKAEESAARALMSEAINCYEMSAYRAAVITTWIAVSSDLIEKLTELALGGDAKAKTEVEQLNNLQEQAQKGDPAAIKGLLGFERSLVELFFHEFQFFGNHEYEDIKRLREDRHRCAHPSFDRNEGLLNPNGENARLHIVNALDHVLLRSPTSGKASLERILNLVASQNFPSDRNKAVERLKASEFGNARESLIRALVDSLIFGVFDEAHPMYNQFNAFNALAATVELYRGVALDRAIRNLNRIIPQAGDEQLWKTITFIVTCEELADSVDLANRATLEAWLSNEDIDIVVDSISVAYGIPWMRDAARNRSKTLTVEELKQARITLGPGPLAQAVSLYCEATSWNQANEIADLLLLPNIEQLPIEAIQLIIKSANNEGVDLLGSAGFRKLIQKAFEAERFDDDVLTATLNDEDLERYIPEA